MQKFANCMTNTTNVLLAVIFKKINSEVRPKIWVRLLREYLGELGLDFSDVGWIDADDTGKGSKQLENKRWRRGIDGTGNW